MTPDRQLLIEAATSARRPPDPTGELRFHPAFHDLDAAGREELFAATWGQRAIERASDARGLSATAREVLRRIGAG